ncbi:T4SS efffector SepA family protein [Sinorhizobium meliloti]|nr:hypothetical protein [Sinorhizobium medicae]
MPEITLSDQVFARIKAQAEPFVDTPESVIIRLLEFYEGGKATYDLGAVKIFDPKNPPNLRHTTVIKAIVNGVALKSQETNWNAVLLVLIRKLAEDGMKPEDIENRLVCNTSLGERTDSGYKFIREAGLSIQGLDANNAWRAIQVLASVTNQTVNIDFKWQNKEGVEMAGATGTLIVNQYEDEQ